ncbi:MAG: PilN domain-containing protein [Pyrinomonadaceae bacterium]
MIKVNLLESVTDRSQGSVAAIETRVANPRTQGKMILIVVAALAVLAMGFDYLSASSSHKAAQEKLKQEQETARQMELVKKEIADLEKKTKDVQTRIDMIKTLRASQEGPVAVLSSINERLPALPNFHLVGIERKDGMLTITGDSPNEAAVTQFGRSLEFSSGLFTDVSIETQRKTMDTEASAKTTSPDEKEVKIETVGFTVKCKYNPPTPPAEPNGNAAGAQSPQQVAQQR